MPSTTPKILQAVENDKIFIVFRAVGLVSARSRCRKSKDQTGVKKGNIRVEMVEHPLLKGELGEMEVVHVEIEEVVVAPCLTST